MTIMGNDSGNPETPEKAKEPNVAVSNAAEVEKPEAAQSSENEKKDGAFSEENLSSSSEIYLGNGKKSVVVSPEDKIAFIDAVVGNTRYTKDYSLFGGKIKLTVRSLTADETNALAAWTVKSGAKDPAGLTSGRYRKYLAAAQVAIYNGTEMPALEEPLFETLESDGKTVKQPGWVERSAFWDGLGYGVFSAVIKCISDFDLIYSTLCKEAENENFWSPDTP